MSPLVLGLLILSVVCAACGQLLFKAGASGAVAPLDFINLKVIFGLFCYGVSTLIWIWTLSKVNLVTVFPFTVMTFVLVYLGAAVIYKEPVTTVGLAGAGVALLGLFMIVRSSA